MANWRTHPDEADLLRYADGEVRARDTARIARHLEACWDCRTELDDLKHTIAEYVRYRRDIFEPALPPPPQPWIDLRAEFAGVQASGNAGPSWRRIFERRAVWLLAGALTAGTGIYFYAAKQPPPEHDARPVVAPAPVAKPAATRPRPILPAPARSSRVTAGPEDELRVMAALDRIGADLGDPIEVVRAPDRIVVRCIGLEAPRIDEVRAALSGLPRVTVELSPKPNAAAAGAPREVTGAPHASLPAELSRQFDSPEAYEKFVDGLLHSSEAMMARAHALRRLALRFPPDVEAGMDAEGKSLLEAMRRGHEIALASEVAGLDRATQPYLVSAAAAPGGNPTAEQWQARALLIFTDAERADRLLGAFFAGAHGATSGQVTPGTLASALAKLKADVR